MLRYLKSTLICLLPILQVSIKLVTSEFFVQIKCSFFYVCLLFLVLFKLSLFVIYDTVKGSFRLNIVRYTFLYKENKIWKQCFLCFVFNAFNFFLEPPVYFNSIIVSSLAGKFLPYFISLSGKVNIF